jgi:zinc transport system permease protein
MFEFAFMQRALIAALIIGLICGVLGFFVVLRRFAFIGVGISHSAIGGVAIGILLGVSPLGTAAIFAVAVALGIAAVSRRATLSEDAVIGVFFSGSMALGIVLFSMNRGFQQDLFGYLFGNVLAITPGELKILAGAAAVILVALALLFKEFLLVAFDEEMSRGRATAN